MGLEGWLRHPRGRWTYRFHRDENSWLQYPFVFIDKGRAMPGNAPALLKTRQYISRRDAIELWKKLRKDGRIVVAPQW
mgnify:FL=1